MSLLNLQTILQRVFDNTTQALRITAPDMAIELSADDGDSVITQKQTVQQVVTAGEIVDVSTYSQITYLHASNPNTTTKIMLLDGITEVNGPTLTTGSVVEINATSLKIVLAGEIVLKS